MKKKVVSFLGFALATVQLSACGTAVTAPTQEAKPESVSSAAEPEATEVPPTATPQAYTGPLYEVSFTNLSEQIPGLTGIAMPWGVMKDSNEIFPTKSSITLIENFDEKGCLEALFAKAPDADHLYLNTQLQLFTLSDDVTPLGAYKDKVVFSVYEYNQSKGGSLSHLACYDQESNSLLTEDMSWLDLMPAAALGCPSGKLPGADLRTGNTSTAENGFFDLETMTWHSLGNAYSLIDRSVDHYGALESFDAGFYGGYHPVYDKATNYLAGYINEEYELALDVSACPELAGKGITMATGFLDGEALVMGVNLDGSPSETTGDDANYVDFVYHIDTSGHVTGTGTTKDVTRQNDKITSLLGGNRGTWIGTLHDSLRIADGLTMQTGADGYELTDANGQGYDLSGYEINSVLVGNNGVVLLYCKNADQGQDLVRLEVTPIYPDDYVIAEDAKAEIEQ